MLKVIAGLIAVSSIALSGSAQAYVLKCQNDSPACNVKCQDVGNKQLVNIGPLQEASVDAVGNAVMVTTVEKNGHVFTLLLHPSQIALCVFNDMRP